tara:strand:- start:4012 stop:4617 length:606 start_codon:yes stop_codon:yes gene_type:complete
MDIKIIIGLRKKINNLSFNLNNFNIFEYGIMGAFGISFFIAIISFPIYTSDIVLEGNTFLGSLIFVGGFLTIPLLFYLSTFVNKFLLRKKSQLFKFLFSNLLVGIKFNASKYINKFLESLTEEEAKLLLEVRNIQKHEGKSINDILEEKIITYSTTANQTDIDFVLDSIDDKKLRHKIFEISQKNKKQESNIVKQKIIKSI